MGWMTRFEPATSGSTDRRSNQLSYIHHKGFAPATSARATLILYKFSFLLGKFFRYCNEVSVARGASYVRSLF